MPIVSIIVPIYNVEKYLNRCLESLINQTLKDIEIILVDDGSPDNCPTMCDEYARKDKRIKVIHKENEGLGYARNSGLDIATGEYIAFVDSDDFVDLDMYETLYLESENTLHDVVFCSYKTYNKNGEISNIYVRDGVWSRNTIPQIIADMTCADFSIREYPTSINMSVWHAIYRKEIFEKHNIRFMSEREVISEDIVFNYTYLKECNSVKYINRQCYSYCFNKNSLSHTFNPSKIYKVRTLYTTLCSLANQFKSPILQERLLRFFFIYHEMNFRNLLLSDMSWENKCHYAHDIYNDTIWLIVRKEVVKRDMPFLNRIKCWLLYNEQTTMAYLFYKILEKMRRKD